MKHFWSVTCHKGIVDKETNQISLVDVITAIRIPPEFRERIEEGLVEHDAVLLPVPMQLVSQWGRTISDEPEAGEARGRIISPSGKVVAESIIPIDLVNNKFYRSTQRIPAFPCAGLGTYALVVHCRNKGGKRWRKATEQPVEIVVTKESEAPL